MNSPRGVAIVMVVLVLAGLVALATPFVFSMVLHGRSARGDLNAAQARAGAEGALNHALAHLHCLVKATAADNKTPLPGSDPTPLMDTPEELRIPMVFPGAAEAGMNFQDPRGVLWSARIEDEQGKVNLHTAPPPLLGNLLGSSVLAEQAEKGAPALMVEDGGTFYSDGNPQTVDGFVRVGGDTVPYNHVKGNMIYLAPYGEYVLARGHRVGDLVYDGRAIWIADYKFVPGRADFRPFRSIYELKAIGDGNPFLSIRPDEFARVERLVTIDSRREAQAWGHAERIGEQSFEGDRQGFTVENDNGFGPGSIVRFFQGGKTITYGRLDGVRVDRRTGRTFIHLERPVGVGASGSGVGNDVFVAPELRHPININTASPEVVRACLMGLGLAAGTETIAASRARVLADFLTRTFYQDSEQFKKALDEAVKRGLLSAQLSDAVYINATEFNSPKLRLSTVPFSFRSGGSFTIEASGVVNSPSGVQLARHTIRQIVTLPSPPPGSFLVRSQEGFQKLLDQGLGQRLVTWPVPMVQDNPKFRRAGVAKEPETRFGDVRLTVGECGSHLGAGPGGRGGGNQGGVLDEWLEHCDDPANTAYFQEGYDIGKHGPFQKDGVPAANGYLPTSSAELWYKPVGGGAGYFFDQGEDLERNRVSFSYEPGPGLVVRIWDAGLESKFTEYQFPAQLNAGQWYHLAASCRSGKVNGQEVRLDGLPYPPSNEQIKFKPSTRLAADVTLDEVTTLELDDGADFPASGAVQVGEEIIEYQTHGGNSLTQLRRGTRMSATAEHKQGELVMPFGYANDFAQDLPFGNGHLVERMEKAPAGAPKTLTTKVNKPGKPNIDDFVLDTETKKIPVLDASDFPPSGYVIVAGEIIHYKKKSATALENLVRAESIVNKTGPARNLRHNVNVVLISVELDRTDEYDKPGIVQIDSEDDDKIVEWIAYEDKKDEENKHYLLAHVGTNPGRIQTGSPPTPSKTDVPHVYLADFKGYFGTRSDLAHAKKAKAIPVVRMAGPHCGDAGSPVGDQITNVSVLTRGQKNGDVRWVKRAFIHQYPNWNINYDRNGRPVSATFTDWSFDFFMGLNDFVSRRYAQRTSRLLKFPSGEMPDVAAAQRHVGESMDGQGRLSGGVDEIKVLALSTLGGRVGMTTSGTGLKAGDDNVLIEVDGAYPAPGGRNATNRFDPKWTRSGLAKIEDELVFFNAQNQDTVEYYADVAPRLDQKAARTARNPVTKEDEPHANIESKRIMKLTGLKRGVLGTQAVDHPPGAYAALYDASSVTALTGALTVNGDSFTVHDAKGFPNEGYALIGNEVVSWTKRGGNTLTGGAPFHGRFGTSPAVHADGDMVIGLPFRYWDRYGREYDGQGLAFLQSGHSSEGAIWETVEVKTAPPAGEPLPNFCRPRIIVRFNGAPGWDSQVTNQEGGLYEFNGSGAFRLRGLAPGGGVKGDQIEVRVFWQYTSGAFQPGQEWKRTFGLSELRATYRSPLVMKEVDLLEKR